MKYVALILSMAIVCSGCSWFVPSKIKKEASLMAVDSKTAIIEINAIDVTKATVIIDGKEMPTAEAIKYKAVKSLTRVSSHAKVLDAYMKGEKAPAITVDEFKSK